MICTSIPFGDHYEYSDNYNDFGHNNGNDNFFKQMDYLIPNLLRVLKPGRIAAIHVKDRIRYSYQNGTSFTTIQDFSGKTVHHFEKHGFYLMGKITVTTDVVAENNQTYRLGWTEQCKDASKMGVGLPEYVLIFRKAPTHMDNSYADETVTKDKLEYTKAKWQLDAHAYHRSGGDRFMTQDELRKCDLKTIVRAWKKNNLENLYSFKEHLQVCEDLDELGKLSSTFMTLPVHSNNDMVWTDINRMRTLNANQVSSKKEKHICPLQFDIIDRLIERYSNPGDLIDDPFGGLFSVPYRCMSLGRKSVSVELNTEYFNDGLTYLKALEYELNVPTLFDMLECA
jgi:DNA modification methylase